MFKRNQLPYDNVFKFQDANINYKVLGKGKPVVFIHGSITNSSSYTKTLELLSRSHKVYILDLPGFGASDTVKGQKHTTELFSKMLSSFIKKTKLEKVPIIAFSHGAIITTESVLSGGIKGKLIFVGAPGKPDTSLLTTITTGLPLIVRRLVVSTNWGRENVVLPTIRANIGKDAKDSNEHILKHLTYTSNEAIADIEYMKDVKKYSEAFKLIKNKVVFIYGETDRMKHVRYAFADNFIEIPKSGHNIFVSSPRKTVEVLRSLL